MKKIKALLILLGIALGLTASAAVQSLSPTVANGEEPEKVGDYYIITTYEHLQWVAIHVNSAYYYKNPDYLRLRLGTDVSIGDMYYTDPIGGVSINVDGVNKISAFWGELDGAGHTIAYNLDDNKFGDNYRALFGNIGFSGKSHSKIHDLVVENPTVNGKSYVGGLAGMALLTDFTNITVLAPVIEGTGSYIGGLVGYADNCSITGCANTKLRTDRKTTYRVWCTAESFTSDPGYVGGIAGSANNTSITACYNSINIAIPDKGFCVGGIAGSHYAGTSAKTIKDCGNTGWVEACDFIGTGTSTTGAQSSTGTQSGICTGGIVGRTNGAQPYTISGCYNNSMISGRKYVGYIYGCHGSLQDLKEGKTINNTVMLDKCFWNIDQPVYFSYTDTERIKIPFLYNLSKNNNNYNEYTTKELSDDDFYGRLGLYLNEKAGYELWGQTLCLSEWGEGIGRMAPLVPQQITTLAALNGKTDGIAPHYCAPGETHCAYCDDTLPFSRPKMDNDGNYAITSVPEYYWYGALVNATMPKKQSISEKLFKIEHPLNAVLEADLTFDPNVVTPTIGNVLYNSGRTFYNSTFDGKGHTISYANITNEGGENVGLFGCVYGSTIRNIKASHCTATGKLYVGIIAGQMDNSNITGCFTDQYCTVTGCSAVGGIVGEALDRDNNQSYTIYRCTNAASIICSDQNFPYDGTAFGGIVGEARSYKIEGCFNNGEIYFTNKKTPTESARMGGIAGWAESSDISFCGNTANINANANYNITVPGIGGIVGHSSKNGYDIDTRISDSYSTATVINGVHSQSGNILGTNGIPELPENNLGAKPGCTIQGCATTQAHTPQGQAITNYPANASYNNVQTLTLNMPNELYDFLYARNSNPAWGQPAWAQLACKHTAPYLQGGYDSEGDIVEITGYHEHAELVNGACPVCKTQVEEPENPGTDPQPGTDPEEHPGTQPAVDNEGYYLIASVDNLIWFRYAVNHNEDLNRQFNARLTRDLDISDCLPWTSIGDNFDHSYMGHFDGQGHTISGMRGDSENPDCCGFFGYMWQSSVTNLTLRTPATIGGSIAFYEGDAVYLGLIAGYADQTTFTGVNVEGYVRGTKDVGGLVGHGYDCDFYDCHYTGWGSEGVWGGNDNNYGEYRVGGIAAYTNRATFVNCTVEGKVSGGNMNYFGNKVTTYTGGIVGEGTGGTTISCCAMTGYVISDDDYRGESRIGGLVGNHFGSDPLLIDRSYVHSYVQSATSYTGNLIGYTTSPYRTERCAYNKECNDYNDTGYGISAMHDSEPAEGFTWDDFANGTVAAYLGAPWGHSFIVDEWTGEFSCPDMMLGEQYPVLGGVPFYYYWDSNINDKMATIAGDLNGNSKWDAEDIDLAGQLISGKTLGLMPWQHEMLMRGIDFNGDGQYTIADITALIARMLHIQQLIDNNNHGDWEPGMGE